MGTGCDYSFFLVYIDFRKFTDILGRLANQLWFTGGGQPGFRLVKLRPIRFRHHPFESRLCGLGYIFFFFFFWSIEEASFRC